MTDVTPRILPVEAVAGLPCYWSHLLKSTLIDPSSTRSPSCLSLEPPYFWRTASSHCLDTACTSFSDIPQSTLSFHALTHRCLFGQYSGHGKPPSLFFSRQSTTWLSVQALIPCCFTLKLPFFTLLACFSVLSIVVASAIVATNQHQSTSVTDGPKPIFTLSCKSGHVVRRHCARLPLVPGESSLVYLKSRRPPLDTGPCSPRSALPLGTTQVSHHFQLPHTIRTRTSANLLIVSLLQLSSASTLPRGWCALLATTSAFKKFLQCPGGDGRCDSAKNTRQESRLLAYCLKNTQNMSLALL